VGLISAFRASTTGLHAALEPSKFAYFILHVLHDFPKHQRRTQATRNTLEWTRLPICAVVGICISIALVITQKKEPLSYLSLYRKANSLPMFFMEDLKASAALTSDDLGSDSGAVAVASAVEMVAIVAV
jgi:hypothetical protein